MPIRTSILSGEPSPLAQDSSNHFLTCASTYLSSGWAAAVAGVVDDGELPPVVTEPAKPNGWREFLPAAAAAGIPRGAGRGRGQASATVQGSHVVVPARFGV